MSILGNLLSPTANINDERLWTATPGAVSPSGVSVSPESAMRVSTVFAMVKVKTSVISSIPLHVFRRRGEGRERLPNHRLEAVLAKPNAWQTGCQFRQLLAAQVMLRGNAVAEILPGPKGAIDQLIPLSADLVTFKGQESDGRLVYEYAQPGVGLRPRILRTGDVLHLAGPSLDGVWGLSVVGLMRDSVGLALATEEHGSRQFGGNSPSMRGILRSTGAVGLNPTQEQQLTGSFARANSGRNAHGVAYLPPGIEWSSVGMSNDDAQFLETRDFQIADLLRFGGVPGVLVGHADKTSTYASAEQFFQSFLTYHLDPDLVATEKAFGRDLLAGAEQGDVYLRHNRNALLRGDAASRAGFYRTMVEMGIFTRNEVRQHEDLNPLDGLDEPLTPLNMQTGQGDALLSRAAQIAREAAGRLSRREALAMGKAWERFSSDPVSWRSAVLAFYAKHAIEVASQLAIDPAVAAAYAEDRCAGILGAGSFDILTAWGDGGGSALAALAVVE
jgi:HK97 family phage portal protein